MKSFLGDWRRYIIGLLAFFPFLTMFTVHRLIGLSDTLMAQPKPGEIFWPSYNLVMVIALYSGVLGYLAYLWVTDSPIPDKYG